MSKVYDWRRVFPQWNPGADAPTENNQVDTSLPEGLEVSAEIVGVRFQREGEKIDRVVTWRICAGEFNNCEVNYRIKWNRPDKVRPLLDAVMPDRKERGKLVAAMDAKVWAEMLDRRIAVITVGLYMGHNYVKEIRS